MIQSRRAILIRVLSLSLLWVFVACSTSRASVLVQLENQDGTKSPQITAELATTASQRSLGLMYRKEMPANHGMLFLFPDESERSFWMKNTYLELDIIYLDSAFRVTSIIKRAVPLSETPRPSDGPAKYVLEVNGGSSDAWRIKPGAVLRIQGELPEPS